MKKVLTKALAAILGVAMFASSLAYVPGLEKSTDSQLSLASVRAVDIQTAISGVRSYSELVDTERKYQVNEVIYLATTVEVKNLEKFTTLKSIEGKKFPTVVGSEKIDLSFSKYGNPILLSHIYSGLNGQAIATAADILTVSKVLSYDKDKNEVKFTFEGYQQNAVGWLAGFSTSNLNNLYLSAYIKDGGETIMIPALRAKDGKTTVSLGNSKYEYSWTAPESMAYTMLLQGVTKNHENVEEGDFYAKIQVSGAEKFVDDSWYYVNNAGKVFADLKTEFGTKTPVEFVDYIIVKVSKLELDKAYNVYKYDVLSNGMIDTAVPVVYAGDHKDYKLKTLAKVNPNLFDNSTRYDGANTDVEVASGVNKVKAVTGYTYNGNGTYTVTTTEDVPLTSVVYTENHTVYAPTYYGVKKGTVGSTVKYAHSDSFKMARRSATKTKTTVDYWEWELQFEGKPYGRNLDVAVFDAYSKKLITNANGSQNGAAYTTSWTETKTEWPSGTVGVGNPLVTGKLRVTPVSNSVYPLGESKDSTSAQAWEIYLGTPVAYNESVATTATDGVAATLYSPAGKVAGVVRGNTTYAAAVATAANGQPVNPVTIDAAYINQTGGITKVWAAGAGVANSGFAAGPYTTTLATPDQKVTDFALNGNAMNTPANMQSVPYPSQNVAVTSPKTISVTEDVLAVTLRANWLDGFTYPGKEKADPTSAIVDLTGLGITSAVGYWTTNQVWQAPQSIVSNGSMTGTGATDADDINDGVWDPTLKAFVISLKGTGDLNTDYKAGATTAFNAATNTAAFVSSSDQTTTVAGGVTSFIDTAAIANNGTAATSPFIKTPAPIVQADLAAIKANQIGWAQNNVLMATVAGVTNRSFGYPNAHIVVAYTDGSTVGYTQIADPMSSRIDIIKDAHNGISVYVVTYNVDDKPLIGIATEATYYDSEDGSTIALFDAYNPTMLARRIYRSSTANLAYSTGAGHVNDTAKMISSLTFFGLDTSFTTGYKVVAKTFEEHGAAAVYSEDLTGKFIFGRIVKLDDEGVDEKTEEDTTDEGEVTDEGEGEVTDEGEGEDVGGETTEPVIKTGDVSTNIAIALAASAIVAAAGLVFVMKKAR